MRKLIFILFILPLASLAQITHSTSFSAGITNVYYSSDISGGKSYASLFLPTTLIDYNKHNDNAFWGGAGIGFTLRHIPYHIYPNKQKVGAEALEFYLRVRAGLKFEGESTTQLPYVSLGISRFSNHGTFVKDEANFGTSTMYYHIDSSFNARKYFPFMELGSKIINTSFREDRANASFTLAIRYYPQSVFNSPIQFEYDVSQFKSIQYHMIEFILLLGFQFNVQR